MYQSKMYGKIHGNQCDCNIEEHVSGSDEKCNRRYGNKRNRVREKNAWMRDAYNQRHQSVVD